jgi:peptidoglycan/LPS O-acetylase OafA/YrhL
MPTDAMAEGIQKHVAGEVRTDIQALRGVAVLLVLVYHADLGGLKAGFLGVDIFFVISGYLITGLICRQVDTGQFSFADFYRRRARRLLPASLVTIAVTSIAACMLLTQLELRSYLEQVIGAITFSSNFVLALQTNYFDTSSSLKPLLHTWSLAVEEQFYLIAPLILWVVPTRFRKPVIFSFLVGSLVLCFVLARSSPTWTFYMLPTRSWELSIGSLIALFPVIKLPRLSGTIAGIIATIALLATAASPVSLTHPGIDALTACLATALIIVTRPSFWSDGPAAHLLARIGDISYSLYLVHWPIFVFARHYYLGDLRPEHKMALLTVSVAVAFALYRFVEKPFHRGERVFRRPVMVYFAIATLSAIAPTVYLAASRNTVDWADLRRPNYGLADSCSHVPPRKDCRTTENPEIALWGDSFAMHLAQGLVAMDGTKHGVVQLTQSTCAPVLDTINTDPSTMASCVSFNRAVLRYLEESSSLKYVVLSAAANYERLEATVIALKKAGKSVVLVGPPPESKRDKSICAERLAIKLPTSDTGNCSITQDDLLDAYRDHIRTLKGLEARGAVRVIWLEEVMCDDGVCKTHENGIPFYRDAAHLSVPGSIEVARKLDLIRRIVAP